MTKRKERTAMLPRKKSLFLTFASVSSWRWA